MPCVQDYTWMYLLLWFFLCQVCRVSANESIIVSKVGLILSSPFSFSDSISNLTITADDGSESVIQPASDFPSSAYVFDVAAADTVTIENVVVDGQSRAGCVQVANTTRLFVVNATLRNCWATDRGAALSLTDVLSAKILRSSIISPRVEFVKELRSLTETEGVVSSCGKFVFNGGAAVSSFFRRAVPMSFSVLSSSIRGCSVVGEYVATSSSLDTTGVPSEPYQLLAETSTCIHLSFLERQSGERSSITLENSKILNSTGLVKLSAFASESHSTFIWNNITVNGAVSVVATCEESLGQRSSVSITSTAIEEHSVIISSNVSKLNDHQLVRTTSACVAVSGLLAYSAANLRLQLNDSTIQRCSVEGYSVVGTALGVLAPTPFAMGDLNIALDATTIAESSAVLHSSLASDDLYGSALGLSGGMGVLFAGSGSESRWNDNRAVRPSISMIRSTLHRCSIKGLRDGAFGSVAGGLAVLWLSLSRDSSDTVIERVDSAAVLLEETSVIECSCTSQNRHSVEDVYSLTSPSFGCTGGVAIILTPLYYFDNPSFLLEHVDIANCTANDALSWAGGLGVFVFESERNENNIASIGSIATIANCSISGCSASATTTSASLGVLGGGFGALLGSGTTVSVLYSNVSSCSVSGPSSVGGGIGIAILKYFSSEIEIDTTTISSCSLNGDRGVAGGLGIYGTNYDRHRELRLTLHNLVLYNITASGDNVVAAGLGLDLQYLISVTVKLEFCTLSSLAGTGDKFVGGGIGLVGPSKGDDQSGSRTITLRMYRSSVNDALVAGASAFAGGIAVLSTPLTDDITITSSVTIYMEEVTLHGCGMQGDNGQAGGMAVSTTYATILFVSTSFSDCFYFGDDGGAGALKIWSKEGFRTTNKVTLSMDSTSSVVSCTYVGNRGQAAGVAIESRRSTVQASCHGSFEYNSYQGDAQYSAAALCLKLEWMRKLTSISIAEASFFGNKGLLTPERLSPATFISGGVAVYTDGCGITFDSQNSAFVASSVVVGASLVNGSISVPVSSLMVAAASIALLSKDPPSGRYRQTITLNSATIRDNSVTVRAGVPQLVGLGAVVFSFANNVEERDKQLHVDIRIENTTLFQNNRAYLSIEGFNRNEKRQDGLMIASGGLAIADVISRCVSTEFDIIVEDSSFVACGVDVDSTWPAGSLQASGGFHAGTYSSARECYDLEDFSLDLSTKLFRSSFRDCSLEVAPSSSSANVVEFGAGCSSVGFAPTSDVDNWDEVAIHSLTVSSSVFENCASINAGNAGALSVAALWRVYAKRELRLQLYVLEVADTSFTNCSFTSTSADSSHRTQLPDLSAGAIMVVLQYTFNIRWLNRRSQLEGISVKNTSFSHCSAKGSYQGAGSMVLSVDVDTEDQLSNDVDTLGDSFAVMLSDVTVTKSSLIGDNGIAAGIAVLAFQRGQYLSAVNVLVERTSITNGQAVGDDIMSAGLGIYGIVTGQTVVPNITLTSSSFTNLLCTGANVKGAAVAIAIDGYSIQKLPLLNLSVTSVIVSETVFEEITSKGPNCLSAGLGLSLNSGDIGTWLNVPQSDYELHMRSSISVLSINCTNTESSGARSTSGCIGISASSAPYLRSLHLNITLLTSFFQDNSNIGAHAVSQILGITSSRTTSSITASVNAAGNKHVCTVHYCGHGSLSAISGLLAGFIGVSGVYQPLITVRSHIAVKTNGGLVGLENAPFGVVNVLCSTLEETTAAGGVVRGTLSPLSSLSPALSITITNVTMIAPESGGFGGAVVEVELLSSRFERSLVEIEIESLSVRQTKLFNLYGDGGGLVRASGVTVRGYIRNSEMTDVSQVGGGCGSVLYIEASALQTGSFWLDNVVISSTITESSGAVPGLVCLSGSSLRLTSVSMKFLVPLKANVTQSSLAQLPLLLNIVTPRGSGVVIAENVKTEVDVNANVTLVAISNVVYFNFFGYNRSVSFNRELVFPPSLIDWLNQPAVSPNTKQTMSLLADHDNNDDDEEDSSSSAGLLVEGAYCPPGAKMSIKINGAAGESDMLSRPPFNCSQNAGLNPDADTISCLVQLHSMQIVCDVCGAGLFSPLSPTTTEQYNFCWACPRGTSCPGGSELKVSTGFWVTDLLPRIFHEVKDSSQRSELLDNAVQACPPGLCAPSRSDASAYYEGFYRGASTVCAPGRTGPLCGGCKQNYSAAIFGHECYSSCPPNKSPLPLLLVAIALCLAYSATIILLPIGPVTPAFRILTYYFNTASLVYFPLAVVSQNWIDAVLQVVSSVINLRPEARSGTTLDFCVKDGQPVVVMLFHLGLPLLLFVSFLCLYAVWVTARVIRKRFVSKRKLWLGLFKIMLLTYSAMAGAIFKFSSCETVPLIGDNGTLAIREVQYVAGTLPCWRSSAGLTLLMSVGMIVIFGVPFCLFLWQALFPGRFLSRCAKMLPERKFLQPMRRSVAKWQGVQLIFYLEANLKGKVWWWDTVLLLRRAVLELLNAYLVDPVQRDLSVSLLCLAILVGHVLIQPYVEKIYNNYETVSLAMLTVSSIIGVSGSLLLAADIGMPPSIQSVAESIDGAQIVVLFLGGLLIGVMMMQWVVTKLSRYCRQIRRKQLTGREKSLATLSPNALKCIRDSVQREQSHSVSGSRAEPRSWELQHLDASNKRASTGDSTPRSPSLFILERDGGSLASTPAVASLEVQPKEADAIHTETK